MKIEGRNYFVSFEITSTICNAFITLKESKTGNEVHAVCYPNLIRVSSVKVDGIEYEVDFNFDKEDDFISYETNRKVKSQEKKNYLKSITNHIIENGNEYLKNTFGNIEREISEIQ